MLYCCVYPLISSLSVDGIRDLALRDRTTSERKGKTNEREKHMARDSECKRCVRVEDEGWCVEEERKEVTRRVGITNKMS